MMLRIDSRKESEFTCNRSILKELLVFQFLEQIGIFRSIPIPNPIIIPEKILIPDPILIPESIPDSYLTPESITKS